MARRRPRQAAGNSVTAAAKRVELTKRVRLKTGTKLTKDWQLEGWAFYDENPEIKFATQFLGNAMAKLRLFVGIIPQGAEVDADPVPIDDETSDAPPGLADAANAELARLRGAIGGQAALLARMNMNFEVAGEWYLVGFGAREQVGTPADEASGTPASDDFKPAQPESWLVASVLEVEVKSGRYVVKSSPGDKEGRVLDEKLDTIIRVWIQHPAWGGEADCAMRGVLNDAKVLQVLTQQQYAETLSRQSAGVLLVPNELSTGPANVTAPEQDVDEGQPTDPFINDLMVALTTPIEDPESAASVMPLVVRGPSEALAAFRHVLLGRQSDDTLDNRVDKKIERISRGLNLPVEVVMGHAATTYANAEQIDEDTFEDHLEPRCRLLVDALSVGYLRPNLADVGTWDPEVLDRVVVWYDAGALVRQPDTEAGADAAFDRFAISDEAYRRAKGFGEDDAPDAIDVIIRAGLRRGILTAELTAALLQRLADEAGVELPAAPAELQPEQQQVGDAQAAAAAQLAQLVPLLAARQQMRQQQHRRPAAPPRVLNAASRVRPSWNPGHDLAEMDRDLRTRLHTATEAAMTRALERAGARLRTKSGTGLRSTLRNVSNIDVAATLGERLALQAATTDDLLADGWDELEQQFRSWAASTQADALDVVSRAVSGLSTERRATLQLRQAADLDEAWGWMREALSALANQRMFDPHPAAPSLGEFDPEMRVPPGLIRQAMSRAGGAAGLSTSGTDAWVALADGGTRPAGGIGTGELVRGELRDDGIGVEGYVWVYGPASRRKPFEPHRQLDGVQFVNFDDDVLANNEGWPEFGYFMPGDHDGCLCDFEPIIIPASEA